MKLKNKQQGSGKEDIYCPRCGKFLLNYQPICNGTNCIVVEKACRCGTKVYYKKELDNNIVFV